MISLEEAIDLLKQEEVVALPTETVYGLAARYDSSKAIDTLYALKGRPKHKALTVNLASFEQIYPFLLEVPEGLEQLMATYWPGPMTLVVDIKEELILPEVRAGGKSCGFRVPDHALTRAVIQEVGPIVLPSANISGQLPTKSAEEAYKACSIPTLDGGICSIGIESTVLRFREGRWKVLREGAISKHSLNTILGYTPTT